jgi:hypothetical protein
MLYLSHPNIYPSLPKAQITLKKNTKRNIRQQSEWKTPNRISYIIVFEELRKYLICNKKDIILLDNSLDLHKN